ncbi:UDP-Glycosyltransferase/glycogen phosphorylase [Rhizopus microsporus ATCC 52813]|uniref:UDP-Glycosyltransferase/glycogen phosphorylase n=1 Tax=Rhizopus microsporus ATCC 52813 TaxID=1340429 RepID=A0A2G4T3Z7_RHIZD|nr:UDP-Glycosyltransferase/glycogen phosphorylase [Rhizopus microsporus ATCC 52813]PHZ15719.1 UDP-Glycosyltransferase/glycogen phosphorylase [Rhizopus microsporus ATCC 52813]
MKLATISLALLLTASNFVFGSAEQTTFDLEPDFRTQKNILFSCSAGGSSHIVWVLSILEELQVRGHHTIYYTREDHAKFIKNAPSVELIVGAPSLVSKEEMQTIQKGILSMSPVDQFAYLVGLFGNRGIDSYTGHLDVFSKKKVDLAICDHFDGTCAEAATKAKIPFIVTSTYAFSPDSLTPYVNRDMLTLHHPTVKGLSFSERLQDKVISPIRFILKAWPTIQSINKKKRAIGVDPIVHPSELPKDSFKLVNSFFGFEPSRPVGPLVEVIGPIIPKTHPVLNTDLQQFLDNHRRVVYVAFGQMAIPSPKDIQLILTSLLENMEAGKLDGVIWGTRGIQDLFPEYLATRSNTTYDVKSFFDKPANGSNIAFVNWAPQVAILHHPSTAMFITHGGAGSLFESMYEGVPVAVFPFFGDQPGNAIKVEEIGIGRWLKRDYDQSTATALIEEILEDKTGKYKRNINRFKAIAQIRSRSGVTRGADVVEEALFTHEDGKITHRRDVRRELSFIKAYNLDIYAFVAAFLVASVSSAGYLVYKAYLYIQKNTDLLAQQRSKSQKLKKI